MPKLHEGQLATIVFVALMLTALILIALFV
jgi:hypothetical protein